MTLHGSADRDPLVALREGDRGPFEEFVRRDAHRFAGFFRRLGASQEEAEDLTQELFVRLYRQAGRYRETDRFQAYCFRAARSAWIDSQRRRSVRLPSAAGGELSHRERADGASGALDEGRFDPAPSPVAHAAQREASERIEWALGQLPETHRLVVELGMVQQLAYAEVGAVLGVPVGTVKSRMFHALRRLRELLGEEFGGPTP